MEAYDLFKAIYLEQVSKQMGVIEQTYYRWRKEYGGLRLAQEVEGVGEGEYPVEEAGGGSVFGQADPEGSVLGKLLGLDIEQGRAAQLGTERLGAKRVSERGLVLGQVIVPGRERLLKPDWWPGWWSWLRNTGVMATAATASKGWKVNPKRSGLWRQKC